MASSKHLVNRKSTISVHASCGRRVLAGMDCGLEYRVDPIPLNLLGETFAKVQGLATYRVLTVEFIGYRDATSIEADTVKGRPIVFAAHRCEPVDAAHIAQDRVMEAMEWLNKVSATGADQSFMSEALMTLQGIIPCRAFDETPPPF